MKRSTILSIFLTVVSSLPLVASAATITDFKSFANILTGIFSILVGLIVTLALVYFLWGVAQFIMNVGDEKKREEGRKAMIWGIVGLFVMISVWGLVNVLKGTFSLNTNRPNFPSF